MCICQNTDNKPISKELSKHLYKLIANTLKKQNLNGAFIKCLLSYERQDKHPMQKAYFLGESHIITGFSPINKNLFVYINSGTYQFISE